MGFRRRRIVNVSIAEFNQRLENIKRFGRKVYNRMPNEGERIGFNVYLYVGRVKCKLLYDDFKGGKNVCEYNCRLDLSEERYHEKTGMDAYIIIQKYYKTPKLHEDKEHSMFTAKAILYHNPKYNHTRNECIGYDINSAYAWAMCQDMPDTERPLGQGFILPSQIGFALDGTLLRTGQQAVYRYPKLRSPFIGFAERYYKKKCEAKGQAKQNYKDILNFSVGYFQKHNCVIRAAIVGLCNQRIYDLLLRYPNDIVYCNTDSIVSLRPIPEIESNIGEGIGQWKVEHKGQFAYVDQNYQWSNESISYRGIPKGWFPEGWDILKDSVPVMENAYELNFDKLQIVKRR